jgi:3-methylfumaryl-CoA hydratase
LRFGERVLWESQIAATGLSGDAVPMNTEYPESLSRWVGRAERHSDDFGTAPLRALAATLDSDATFELGDDVPPLRHWLYFAPLARQSRIGADGHPERGDFLPPVELPRRMWAGGELTFHHALHAGDEVVRDSRILSVDAKEGKSGSLVFVKVRHEISNAKGVAITEQQDIVYRDAARPGVPAPVPRAAPTDEQYSQTVAPDPVLLFRYSALTFNGHRIHYDRPYATGVEGYPGLVVHGPLIATLLLELARRQSPGRRVIGFGFRAMHPLFDTRAFEVCGRDKGDGSHRLWARNHEGALAMEASVRFS